MRIAGVIIPVEKRLVIALQYIYGVGAKRAQDICEKAKINPSIRVKELTPNQEETILKTIQSFEYILDSDLRRDVSMNIKHLQDVGCYRGYRHRLRLPARGQRTKTNARTRKGKKRAAVANKKIATK